jgi:hypothetical protein
VQNFLLEDVPSLDRFLAKSRLTRCTTAAQWLLEAEPQVCEPCSMQKTINSILHNPAIRALILVVLVIPISAYLGMSPVRRGFLYYTGVFAPSIVAAVAAGLWTWSWKWFWLVLLTCSVITVLIQAFLRLLG